MEDNWSWAHHHRLNSVHLDPFVRNRKYTDDPWQFEEITFIDGTSLIRVHPFIKCVGRNCTIHNPSEHPLSGAPLNWRDDKGIFERMCPHDVGHDDPDDVEYRKTQEPIEEFRGYIGVHGCDGCCSGTFDEVNDVVQTLDVVQRFEKANGIMDPSEIQKLMDPVVKDIHDDGNLRTFASGATRDTDERKNDYEAFLSPSVIRRYGDYMQSHRIQTDGQVRPGDNWQKGISKDAYMKSMWRHFMDIWTIHRGNEAKDFDGNVVNMDEALSAMLFNVMGYLHEELKGE